MLQFRWTLKIIIWSEGCQSHKKIKNIYDSIYVKYPEQASSETENRLVSSCLGPGVGNNGNKEWVWIGMRFLVRSCLKLDDGCCSTMWL